LRPARLSMLALQTPLLGPCLASRRVQCREQCAKIVLIYREHIWIGFAISSRIVKAYRVTKHRLHIETSLIVANFVDLLVGIETEGHTKTEVCAIILPGLKSQGVI
jgi:hypothetical protein